MTSYMKYLPGTPSLNEGIAASGNEIGLEQALTQSKDENYGYPGQQTQKEEKTTEGEKREGP